jgi:hypothetical protein
VAQGRHPISIFDLSRLPINLKKSLTILLLLPLGVLLTAFFRDILGFSSYGTFTPSMIGLALVYADWVTTALIFSIVIIVGISGRGRISKYKLPRPSRLAILFTVVAITMGLGLSLIYFYKLAPEAHLALLPIVILATLIDRIYSVIDQYGYSVAMKRLFVTVFIALLCMLIMQMDDVGEWLLRFPETHLVTIAVILLIGKYRGPRLTDKRPFRMFRNPEKKPRNVKSDKSAASATGGA